MESLWRPTSCILLTLVFQGPPGRVAAQCRTADAQTASTIRYLTKLVTAPASDVENYTTRQRYGLPVTTAVNISVVTKVATCNSALRKYQATVALSPAPTSLYVVSVGNTYVVWDAATPQGSEFQVHLVMSSKFAVLSGFAG